MILGIIGAIGVDDIGDVIILKENLQQLREICSNNNINIEFIIFALNKDKCKTQIREINFEANIVEIPTMKDILRNVHNNFTFKDLFEIDLEKVINDKIYWNEFMKCDALFFIGGGYFNNYWNNKLISTFIIPIILGYKFRKSIFISGVNIGPFDERNVYKLQDVFKEVNSIILRDRQGSLEMLEKLGGTNGNIILGADDILSIHYSTGCRGNVCTEKKLNYAVIQLHHLVECNSTNYVIFYKELSAFLNNIIDNGFIDRVYFLPFDYFKGLDYECGRRLKTFLNNRKEYIVLNPTKDYIFMRDLIKNSKFVIASRYHPIVLGLGNQVPCLGIYVNDLYKQKISGAFEVMNIYKNMVNVNDVSNNILFHWYKNIIGNYKKNYFRNSINLIKKYDLNRRKNIEKFVMNVYKKI
ncbi:polysaccharide pyruvyl transferase family protein [Clostridium sp. cel8]|uniref:polysaccharide pyruvyl transferase family protein n=1 Tax=Clostridium sp. cel8 TaxID=2663123 RepID=UPI0015F55FF2|nr:polysaccharide pyruvyl transferase family protein [Clostridium sp. cel8]MBA5851070.1 polysaccharide pyruvyl transferase family protein [Clostridium sp. cel8]